MIVVRNAEVLSVDVFEEDTSFGVNIKLRKADNGSECDFVLSPKSTPGRRWADRGIRAMLGGVFSLLDLKALGHASGRLVRIACSGDRLHGIGRLLEHRWIWQDAEPVVGPVKAGYCNARVVFASLVPQRERFGLVMRLDKVVKQNFLQPPGDVPAEDLVIRFSPETYEDLDCLVGELCHVTAVPPGDFERMCGRPVRLFAADEAYNILRMGHAHRPPRLDISVFKGVCSRAEPMRC